VRCEYQFVRDPWCFGNGRQCSRFNTWTDEITGLRLCSQHLSATRTRVSQCKHCQRWKSQDRIHESGYCWRCHVDLTAPEYTWGEHCLLEICESCDRRGSKRQISYRGSMPWRDLRGAFIPITLCMACWNRWRPYGHACERIAEVQKLINRLHREVTLVRKRNREIDGRIAQHAVRDDRPTA
jgi:hypothetical protein